MAEENKGPAQGNGGSSDILSFIERERENIVNKRDGQTAEVTIEGDPGVMDYVKDVGQGILNGAQEGLVETAETVEWVAGKLKPPVPSYGNEGGLSWTTEEEALAEAGVERFDLIEAFDGYTDVEDPSTMPGQITSGISQFVTGYALAGKALKGAKVGGNFVKPMVQGGIADFMSFDAHEKRFSNFLRDNFHLQDPVTEYLAADEDDSIAEGKLKNVLEGMGLGLAADGVVRVARGIKKGIKAKSRSGAKAAADAVNEEIEKAVDDGALPDPDEAANTGSARAKASGGDATGESSGLTGDKASVDEVARTEARQSKPEFDTGEFQKAIEYEIGLARGGSVSSDSAPSGFDVFNWDKMDSDISTKKMMKMAVDAVPDNAVQDTKTFEGMFEGAESLIADSLDARTDDVSAFLRKSAEFNGKQQEALLAGKMLLQSMNRELENVAYKISHGTAGDVDYDKMVRLKSRVMELSADIKSVQKGAAQTTAAGRIRTADYVSGEAVDDLTIKRQANEGIDAAGGRDKIDKLAEDILANKKAGARNPSSVIASRPQNGFWDVAIEVRTAGLLSGMPTQAINVISTGLYSAAGPAGRMSGALLNLDPARFKEGARMYHGAARAARDSLKYMKTALKEDRNILDPQAGFLEANNVDIRAIQSQSDNAFVRNTINGLGHAIRLPMRGLTAGDEFFKQMNYRADLYARLMTQADEFVSAGRLSRKEAATWVDTKMRESIGADGGGRDLESLSYAREMTFTNELRPGSSMRGLQNIRDKSPVAKVLFPFFRTPVNLMLASVQRTPLLRRTSKNLIDDLESGVPSRVADAKGKIAVGNVLWGTAAMAAYEGKITGGGPVDPEARKTWLETHQPYSVKMGGKWVSYQRLDPYATFFGMAADFASIAGEIDEAQAEDITTAGIAAIANNVASKTFLQGAVDAADAFSNPEMSGAQYANNMVTSFIPYSSLLRQGRKADDPYMRDTRGDPNASFWELEGLVNSIKNTVPGYSKTLPAKHSWITGKPIVYPEGYGSDITGPVGDALASINPIYAKEAKGDFVMEQLMELPRVPSAPQRKIYGVDLTPEQYETYLKLHGRVRAPGTKRTLYQELERVMNTKAYDKDRKVYETKQEPVNSYRMKTVDDTVRAYRDLAKGKLIELYPEIGKAIKDRAEEANASLQEALTGVKNLSD